MGSSFLYVIARRSWAVLAAVATVCAVLAASSPLVAATDTWVGSASANWSTGSWLGDNPPLSGDSLVFAASGSFGTALTDDVMTLSTSSVAGITFNAGAPAYTINPLTVGTNGFTLTGNIVNNSTNLQTINDAIALTGTETVTMTAGGGNISLGGVISGTSPGGITTSGAGTLFLTGTGSSYGGTTTIGAGTVLNVASLANDGVNSSIGAVLAITDTTAASIGLVFTGGTLQYTGAAAESTNRRIGLFDDTTNAIDASGSTSGATLSFTATSSPNLFDGIAGARTLILAGSNTGNNTFAIALGDDGSSGTSLVKKGAGTWIYSGGVNSTTALPLATAAAGHGTITVSSGLLIMTGLNNGRLATVTGLETVTGGSLEAQANSANTTSGISYVLSQEETGSTQALILDSGGSLLLRSDSSVTFAGGNNLGGLTSATVNIDVNQVTAAGTNQTLSLAPSGFNTSNTTINVTGGNGYSLTLGPVNSAGGNSLTLNANSAGLNVGNITNVGTLTVGGTANVTLGAISSGTLVKSNPGLLAITGSSAYTSPTTISAGTLALGAKAAGQELHLSFNGVITDSSGNNNNALLVGGPTYTTGVQPQTQAINFNGTNQYATVPNTPSLDLSGSYTVSLWEKATALLSEAAASSGGPALFSTRNGGLNYTDLDIQVNSAGLHCDIGPGGTANSGTGAYLTTAANATVSLGAGVWNMITLTVAPTGYRIFVDGQAVPGVSGTYSNTGIPVLLPSGANISIGSQEAGGTSYPATAYFNGAISEVQVFNSALSPAQVASLYSEGSGNNVIPATSPLTLANGTTLDLVGVNQTVSLSAATSGSNVSVVNSTISTPVTLTLSLTGNSSTFSGVIGGDTSANAISLAVSGPGAQVLLGNNTYLGATTISGGTLQIGNGGASGSIASTSQVINNGALVFNRSDAYGGVFVPAVSGSGSLTLSSGSLTLGGASTYTGATAVLAGTLQLAGSAALASIADYNFAGASGLANNANYRAIDYAGSAANTPWTPTGSSWTFQNHAGIVTGNGGWNVPPEPSGNQAAALQSLGNFIPRAYQVVNFPAAGNYTISFDAAYSTAGSSLPAAVLLTLGGSGASGGTIEGSITPASSSAWTPYSISFNVAAAGNYQLMFSGPLSNANTISLVSVVAGVQNSGNLPAGTALTVAGGATFDLNGVNQTVASLSDSAPGIGGTITDSAAGTTPVLTVSSSTGSFTTFSGTIQNGAGMLSLAVNGNGTLVLAGNNTYSGPTTIYPGATLQIGNGASGENLASLAIANSGTLACSFSDNLSYPGTISGTGALVLYGPGMLTLTGLNNFTGSTTINGGVLQVGSGGTLGSISSTSSVMNNGTLLFNRSDSYGGNFSPAISGNGIVTLSGGTLSLTGVSSYFGATSVNAGTLVVAGSGGINFSSGISINGPGAKFAQTSSLASTVPIALTQGTLDGTGTVGSVTVADGTGGVVTNGFGGTGALTIGALTFNGVGTVTLNPSSTPSTPALVVSNALTTGATNPAGIVTINVNPPPGLWANNTTYDLIGYGSLTGVGSADLAQGNVGGLSVRQTATLGYSGNDIILTIVGYTPTWTGSDSNSWVVGPTGPKSNWSLVPGNTPTNFIQGDDVVFNDSASTGLVNISAANVSPTSTTFSNNLLSYTLTSASGYGIASGLLVKSGAGTLTIATTGNTYSGGTQIEGGRIILAVGGGLPSGGAVALGLNGSSGTLDLAGNNQTVGALAVGPGANPASQVITSSVGSATLTYSAAGQYSSYSGSIQNAAPSGTLGLTVSAGTLDTTSGSTVYSGATNVGGGLLVAGPLPNTSGVFIGPSGALSFPAAGITTPALSNSGMVSFTAASGAATVPSLNGPGTTSFSGAANIGALLGGVATVAGSASITSATGGTANFNGAAASITTLGNTVVNISGNTALSIVAGSQTAAGSINGGGSVTTTGPGMLALGGSNTYTGGTTVTGGTLQYAAANALPVAGAVNVNGAGAVLDLGGYSSNAGTLTLTNGTVQDGTLTAPVIALQNGLISANLAGNGIAMTMSNSGGAVVLSGSNTFTGTTTISAGSLQLGSQSGIPDNTTVALTGGTLDVNGFNKAFNQTTTFAASGTLTNNGATASTLSLTDTGTAYMTIASLVTNGANSLGFSVTSLGGTAGENFDFTNPANTFTGGVSVSNASARMFGTNANTAMGAGTITISNSGFVMLWANTGSDAGSVTVSNNFVLNTLGGAEAASGAPNRKTAIFTDGSTAGSVLTILTGSIDLASNGGVDAYANGASTFFNALEIAGPISGTGALYKGILNAGNGGGPVTLTNTANSYSGGTVINQGTLDIMADSCLGTGGVTIYSPSNSAIAPSTLQAGANIVLNSGRTIAIGTGADAYIDPQTYTMTVAGPISGSGVLTKVSAGTLILGNSANSFGTASAGLAISAGVVQLGPGANISTANNNGVALTMSGGTLDLNGASGINAQVGSLAGLAGTILNSDTNSITLTVGGNNANGGPFAGSLTNGNGTLSFQKIGSGRMVLTGVNNTYTGSTTVSAGTLALIASAPSALNLSFNGTAADSSGNNNNATLVNGPTYTTGVLPQTQAISFNGTNQYATVPYSASLNVGGSYTLSLWEEGNLVSAATAQAGGPPLFSTRNGGTFDFDLQANSAGLHADIGNGSVWLSTSANAAIALGSGWNMITYTVAPSGYQAFVNGQAVPIQSVGGYTGTYSTAGTPTFLVSSAANISIASQEAGTTAYGDGGYFNGAISQVQVFSGVLSASQIASLYSYGNGIAPTFNSVLPAASPLVVAGGATLDLAGGNQVCASLSDASPGSGGLIVNSAASTPAALTLNLAGSSTTFSGVIGGDTGANPISLTVAGSGLQVLAGANTYYGATTISGGTLQLGTGDQGHDGSIANTSGVTNNSALVYNLYGAQTANYAFSGSGSLTLTSGTLVLAAAVNSYSGPTIVNGGFFSAGGAFTFSPNSAVTVNGGTLDATAGPQTIGPLTMGALGTLNLSAGNLLISTGSASLAGALNVLSFSGSAELMSYSSETGAFGTVAGIPGGYALQYTPTQLDIVVLPSWVAGNGNWSVGTNWSTGSSPNAPGQLAGLNQSNSGSVAINLDLPVTLGALQFGTSTTSYTLSGNTLTFSNPGAASTVTVLGGTHAIESAVYLQGGGLAISVSNSGSLRIGGDISDDGNQESLILNGDGSGQLVLSGTNTYTGGTYVNAGSLVVDSAASLPDGSSLTVGAGASSFFAPLSAGPTAAASPAGLAAVPEPGTLWLLLAALGSANVCRMLAGRRSHRKTRQL
jgi:fibronectin-binding autotransporter adhesin